MDDNKKLEGLLEITLEQVEKEHAKLLKLIQENDDQCFGENSKFKTMEEYSIAIGTLSNMVTYAVQLNQAKAVQKAQKDNIEQLKKNAKEAK